MIESFCAVLVTNNLEKQLSFYKEVLGLDEMFKEEDTIGLGSKGNLNLVLRKETNPNSHHLQENKGPIILTFKVTAQNRDSILGRMREKSYKIRETLHLLEYGSEYVFIEDSDGNELCLDVL